MDPTTDVPWTAELDVLAQVMREASQFRGLSRDDAHDFAQSVYLRLIERDYDVFRQFAGRSSLKTYLRVVVSRLLLDWRNAAMGKWRPSAAARRLGDAAVELERLVYRDRHPADEAIEIARTRHQSASVSDLRELLGRLPVRPWRRRVEPDAIEVCTVPFADPIDAAERREATLRKTSALRDAIQRLAADDRRLLGLHYRDGQSIRDVAHLMQMDVKQVYRRFERVRRSLRRALLAAAS